MRSRQLAQLEAEYRFDVVILGGGINGACLYDALCRDGYKVLLADHNDFASGTSQASGMMIWGGLLYLKNFDVLSVFRLSYDRDQIIRQKPQWMAPKMMRYLPMVGGRRARWWMHPALWLYWLIGMGRRRIPHAEASYSEAAMIRQGLFKDTLCYEEAFLDQSDARYVNRWIAPSGRSGQMALNYCALEGDYAPGDKQWHMTLTDTLSAREYDIEASMIVNCTGVWTDKVNADFGIDAPFRHVLSKGVYLGLPRDERHQSSLFFDTGEDGEVITHVPWGPISLWGPTETVVENIEEGLFASSEDIDFLLEHYARRYREPIDKSHIVSLRCGIRPLVVDKHYQLDCHTLNLSRRQEVVRDSEKPWISCYGGKITGAHRMTARVVKHIEKSISATGTPRIDNIDNQDAESQARHTSFPGLAQPVLSAAWCAEHEHCCTLEDYLRRRTNIAQWIPRGGLGVNDANAQVLKELSLQIARGDAVLADQLFEAYRDKIETTFDPLLI